MAVGSCDFLGGSPTTYFHGSYLAMIHGSPMVAGWAPNIKWMKSLKWNSALTPWPSGCFIDQCQGIPFTAEVQHLARWKMGKTPPCPSKIHPILVWHTGYRVSKPSAKHSSCSIQITNSTAQGGGGSFKNRKPIGEVGCCESRMAERSRWWIERWLISLTLSLSLSLFLSFSDYLPTYLPTDLSIYRSIYLCISSVYLSISIYLSVCLSIYLAVPLFCLSVCLSIYLSNCLSIYLSI